MSTMQCTMDEASAAAIKMPVEMMRDPVIEICDVAFPNADIVGSASLLEISGLNSPTPPRSGENEVCMDASHLQSGGCDAIPTEELIAWEVGRMYPIVPRRLSFTVHTDDNHTLSEIRNNPDVYFCSTDLQERYAPFCADFGPVNIGWVASFCSWMRDKLNDPRLASRHVVYYCNSDADIVTNTAFMLSAFLVMECGWTPEQAVHSFFCVRPSPLLLFRDATYTRQTFGISILDCVRGLSKAMQHGWLCPMTFDIDQYFDWDDPSAGDMHRICPKFIAFKGPGCEQNDLATFPASFYAKQFRSCGVRAVVRLNDAHTYEKQDFEKEGIKHYDLFFDDCSVPPYEIVKKFLMICDEEDGLIAVHCLAGLGRTGTLIAIWMMTRFGMTARESISWLRIVRPGSVIGQQQHFLESIGEALASGLTIEDMEKWPNLFRSDSRTSKENAIQVTHGLMRRSNSLQEMPE
eukprot:CAMPEP_0181289484 /NCGR_PEP_ID=MMETSP1101-20121128/905_1 /TAXON_ID=46948 /ORGANISM="Rhodomonas abbreviata, Strain Caron Lab Isolate" /LENGTH=462 /DNA_ID=CAMNT_0023393705 /DNA_START=36 /DNA_END=1424 /DNA_ORIENTATION=+